VALATTGATAHTYNHGKTVWFTDTEIPEGDEVRGDLNVFFANVACDSGAQIDGNVNVYFGDFDPHDGCDVGGRVNDFSNGSSVGMLIPWLNPDSVSGEVAAENHRLFEQLGWDIVVVFAFLLFPLRVRIALDRVERHPGLSAATGTLALIAVIPIMILLAISIIGIPLIVLEIAALFAGAWIGQAAVSLLIGRRLYELVRPHTTPSPLGALVLGLIVVSAAEILPVVGWAVLAVVWLVGLGAAILAFVREVSLGPPPGGAPLTGTSMRQA
jgi:hypothetical protein